MPMPENGNQDPHRPRPVRCRSLRRLVLGVVTCLGVLAGAAAPAAAQLRGVDVASHQHPDGAPIDWNQVRASGMSFAFVKASEGTTYRNPYFGQDWAGAGAAGLYRGAYHYARPAHPLSTAVDQARFFVSTTGTMGGGRDLPAVLDLEETGGLSQGDLAQWARLWLEEVDRLTGRAPIVYTGYYFWRDRVGNPTDIGARYRLWLPSYPFDPDSLTFVPLVPAGWNTWTFWQYRSDGTVPGIPRPGHTDVNRFCCDAGTLDALARRSPGAGNPFGGLDRAERVSPSTARVQGWAIDPDTTNPIQIHVYVDGTGHVTTANTHRGDVAVNYRGFGDRHGFSVDVPIGPQSRRLCAYAINTGSGDDNRGLGCRTLPAAPTGSLDRVAPVGPGRIQVSGWAIDPNTAAATDVHVYVAGRGFALRADRGRGDVGRAFPGYGSRHGFDARLSVPPGRHQACAYAINSAGPGQNRLVGCRTVNVPSGDPFGHIDDVRVGYGRVDVSGWAIDPDTAAPIPVHVYVGLIGVGLEASSPRLDVGTAFPGYGPNHGFSTSVQVPGGTYPVCTYGVNVAGIGGNRLLGCRDVTVPSGDPFGAIDTVARTSGGVRVAGWAIDPDTDAPIPVHAYVGPAGHVVTADRPRGDVQRAFPGVGSRHGFSAVLPIGAGPTQVCLHAVNADGPGGNRLLGCRVV